MTSKRLGVLGGSFNPIHLGHLHIAERSHELFGLSEILFVVATVPPHKSSQGLVPFEHRYAMTSLATSGRAHFLPSMVEMTPPASAFTIETLGKLQRLHGVTGEDLYFIAGGDSLLEVGGWHESASLLMSYNFVFVMRPGFETPDIGQLLPADAARVVVDCRGMEQKSTHSLIASEQASPGRRIYLVDARAPHIAASQVRRLVARGENIGHLVPAPVQEYILKLHLYGE